MPRRLEGLEVRKEMMSHFAGDESHSERLSDLLKVTQSANDWIPSKLADPSLWSSAGVPLP